MHHFPLHIEPWLQYIANESMSAKETVSPKICENIEMLVCFVCMGDTKQDFDWYQSSLSLIMMNQDKNWPKKLNINIYKVTFLLYQLLMFLNLFIVYLFREKRLQKKVYNCRQLVTTFYLYKQNWEEIPLDG